MFTFCIESHFISSDAFVGLGWSDHVLFFTILECLFKQISLA